MKLPQWASVNDKKKAVAVKVPGIHSIVYSVRIQPAADWTVMMVIAKLKDAARTLLDIVYPEACLLCGREFPVGSRRRGPVCPECAERLRPLSGRRCLVCGLPLVSEIERCLRCRGRVFAFSSHRSLFEYRDEIRELLYYFKFRGRAGLADFFADIMLREKPWGDSPEIITPVPSRAERVRRRGLAHVNLLAKRLSRMTGVPFVDCLKQKPGPAQKCLDVEERLANLQGRICLKHADVTAIRRKTVLLIDDIFTTGATVSECARVLMTNGAVTVSAVTVAQDV